MSNLSQWAKDVKKSLIDRDMTMSDLAIKLGYSPHTVSAVVTGKYPNATGETIVEKINTLLGTEGSPERVSTEEWQESIRIGMIKKHLSVTDLAADIGVTRDKLSQIINGRQMDEDVVAKVVERLEIESPVVPSD